MIVLGHAVLKGPNLWVLLQPVLPERDHLSRGFLALVRFGKDVVALVEELTRCRVEHDDDVLARFVACLLDRFENQFDRLLIGLQLRSKPTFIANAGAVALLMQHCLKCMESLCGSTQRLTE